MDAITNFVKEFYDSKPHEFLAGLGSLGGLAWLVWRIGASMFRLPDWVRRGQEPKLTFSSTKNPEKDYDEIDPYNWATGHADRWCLMREQRKGDYLRVGFKRKLFHIKSIRIFSDHEDGFPLVGLIEFKIDHQSWEASSVAEKKWGTTVTHNLEGGLSCSGVGIRILKPRMEPGGDQWPNPAWSVSRIELKVRRWRWMHRTIVIPWG